MKIAITKLSFQNKAILPLIFFITIFKAHSFEFKEYYSVFGEAKYHNAKNFEYVNPDAPKGGNVKLAKIGTFDSLNPFILKGNPLQEVVYSLDSLMKQSLDEELTIYPLIAKGIKISDDKKNITFLLNNSAKWHNGKQITSSDVIFTFNTLMKEGHPNIKMLLSDISNVKAINDTTIEFINKNPLNRELPVIIATIPILSKEYYNNIDFNKTTLIPPLGSGPYKITHVEPGRKVKLSRNKTYWAKDLTVNKGKFNFDEITFDYYRDSNIAVEALKAGEYDFRKENISKIWNESYVGENFNNKKIIKNLLVDGNPTGMQAFVFNLRKDIFKDINLRKALNYAYNFEWANKNLFYDAYVRNNSFFSNSDFASSGLPQKGELEILQEYRNEIPSSIFSKEFQLSVNKDQIEYRKNLIKARDILEEAGYQIIDNKLYSPQNIQIKIEFLITSPVFERVIAPFVKNLEKLGIESNIRNVDNSQYISKLKNFDFDIIVYWFIQGPVPGNEQINYWHSNYANVKGSNNILGVKNKAIDNILSKMIKSSSKQELIDLSKSLDRILLWNYYVIPQWHSRTHRVVYWNKFGKPKTPKYSLAFIETWWIKNIKDK